VRTINGASRDTSISAEPGDTVRVRVINTDNGPIPVWVPGTAFRVVAVDGYDVNQPDEVVDRSVLVTAGGRADLEFTAPARVQIAGASLVVGEGGPPAASAPSAQVDFLSYGQPAPIGFDAATAARDFRYDIGRRPGLLDGRPGMWWTINGRMYPDVPMFMVQEGEVARFTIANHSGEVHPMHLHGHHMVVLSRNGVPASGSPWWVDSLNVADGESYEAAFLADNPGIWMDHCHNLPHASQGLITHLMYAGVDTPFVIGGDHDNDPE
jgi:FtsP/CotA-like multicopper oxidase with cupredoxin domain